MVPPCLSEDDACWTSLRYFSKPTPYINCVLFKAAETDVLVLPAESQREAAFCERDREAVLCKSHERSPCNCPLY